MPKFVLRNAYVLFAGVDLSDHCRSVTVQTTKAEIDVTAMGAGGRQRLAGIGDDRFIFEMYSDFDASKVDQTLWPLFTNAATFSINVAANGGVAGTANPIYYGTCVLLTYNPIAGAVGDASMTPIECPLSSGTISKATS